MCQAVMVTCFHSIRSANRSHSQCMCREVQKRHVKNLYGATTKLDRLSHGETSVVCTNLGANVVDVVHMMAQQDLMCFQKP